MRSDFSLNTHTNRSEQREKKKMREKRRGIGFETVAIAWGGAIVETQHIFHVYRK